MFNTAADRGATLAGIAQMFACGMHTLHILPMRTPWFMVGRVQNLHLELTDIVHVCLRLVNDVFDLILCPRNVPA